MAGGKTRQGTALIIQGKSDEHLHWDRVEKTDVSDVEKMNWQRAVCPVPCPSTSRLPATLFIPHFFLSPSYPFALMSQESKSDRKFRTVFHLQHALLAHPWLSHFWSDPVSLEGETWSGTSMWRHSQYLLQFWFYNDLCHYSLTTTFYSDTRLLHPVGRDPVDHFLCCILRA